MAKIGSVINEKYEVLREIGRGGMSTVYLAMDNNLNKQWAIKEITKKEGTKNNTVIVDSARVEAEMLKEFDHPALPRIVDILDYPTVVDVIMDYIEGETLFSIVKDCGALPQDIVIDYAKQLCDVLDYIHTRHIIYLDLKAENIMVKPDGNLKLIDFGVAKEIRSDGTVTGEISGTKGYAPPEQMGVDGIVVSKSLTIRTDIYSLGATLYNLVTGKIPGLGEKAMVPIRQINPALSSGLEKIIQKCTQLDPNDRYQSSAEVLFALNHYDEMDDFHRETQKGKLRTFVIVAGICVFFLLVGIFGQLMKFQSTDAAYNNNMELAMRSATDGEKIEYFLAAIDIKPMQKDGYLGIIDAFKDDAAFSVSEEEELKKRVNSNLLELRKIEGYGALAFEISKLYWYYYDYGKTESGDNQVTRMKSAIQWFDDAITYGGQESDFYETATIYRDIGRFSRDITLNIEEASDKGMYSPYWTNIKELLAVVERNPNENEIVKLELYKLTMYSLEAYGRKFKADGVAESDLLEVYNSVKTRVSELQTSTEKTEGIKQDIVDRLERTKKAIENAYRQ